jgi:Leucine-rich repeat (LRR) protein
LNDNPLQEIPVEISRLSKLKSLDISNIATSVVPKRILIMEQERVHIKRGGSYEPRQNKRSNVYTIYDYLNY